MLMRELDFSTAPVVPIPEKYYGWQKVMVVGLSNLPPEDEIKVRRVLAGLMPRTLVLTGTSDGTNAVVREVLTDCDDPRLMVIGPDHPLIDQSLPGGTRILMADMITVKTADRGELFTNDASRSVHIKTYFTMDGKALTVHRIDR